MRFHLIDRILELVPGERIKALKTLSLAEEYLADHFPTFAVMPGVLMIESLVQSAGWLIRASRAFEPTVLVLREARNVAYGSFVEPGRQLETEVTIERCDAQAAATVWHVRGVGRVGGQQAVRAKLILSARCLAADQSAGGPDHARDERLRQWACRHFSLLGGPAALAAAATTPSPPATPLPIAAATVSPKP